MSDKPKVAIYGLGACAGCEEAIIDLNAAILQVADAVEIVLWPLAMDFKYSRIQAMPDGEIAISILSGAVRNSDHQEMAELLRKKSRMVLALGACACFGGTPGLANFRGKDDIFNWVYRDAPTVVNPSGSFPQPETVISGRKLTLPRFFEHVFTLDQVIDVDYYLPGCPPPPELIANAISCGAFRRPAAERIDACAPQSPLRHLPPQPAKTKPHGDPVFQAYPRGGGRPGRMLSGGRDHLPGACDAHGVRGVLHPDQRPVPRLFRPGPGCRGVGTQIPFLARVPARGGAG